MFHLAPLAGAEVSYYRFFFVAIEFFSKLWLFRQDDMPWDPPRETRVKTRYSDVRSRFPPFRCRQDGKAVQPPTCS